MTAERLIEINKDQYLLMHKFNEEDYGKIQNVLGLLSFHHSLSDKPKVGDLTDALPKEARPFMGFSNGSLCTCYFVRDDDNKEIVIYKPNPNSKQVYDAMDIHSQIKYVKEHGEAGPKIS